MSNVRSNHCAAQQQRKQQKYCYLQSLKQAHAVATAIHRYIVKQQSYAIVLRHYFHLAKKNINGDTKLPDSRTSTLTQPFFIYFSFAHMSAVICIKVYGWS